MHWDAESISEQQYRRDVHRISEYLTLPVRVARAIVLLFLYGVLLPLGAFLIVVCLYSLFEKGN